MDRKKTFLGVALFVLCLVALSGIIPGTKTKKVYAIDDWCTWIDVAVIGCGAAPGTKGTLNITHKYFDVEPYDDNRHFYLNSGCGFIDGINENKNPSEAFLHYQHPEIDVCEKSAITMHNVPNHNIIGFRESADIIMAYKYTTSEGPNTGLSMYKNPLDKTLCAGGCSESTYLFVKADGNLDQNQYITTSPDVKICHFARASLDCYDGTLANNGAIVTNHETWGSIAEIISQLNGQSPGEGEDTCESSGGLLGWIMCPVVKMLDSVFGWLDTSIQALLEVNQDMYKDPNLKEAWGQIRNIAYLLLVPIMLVMVLGTALGFGVFDAYTVKKALPRMVAAVIFIALSWWIATTLILISNVIGHGTLGLMTNPFSADLGGNITLSDLFKPSIGGGVVQYTSIVMLMAAFYFVPGVVGIIGMLLLTGILGLATGLIVLIIRQLVIIALVLLAPLAILAWIFPNNDKLWKMWWNAFTKLLIMFPMIMGLLAAGRIFAYIVGHTPSEGLQGGLLNPLIKIVAYIGPYFFIPATFKFAGGAMAAVSGMASKMKQPMSDRLRKGRQQKYSSIAQNAKKGELLRGAGGGNMRDRVSRGVAGVLGGPKSGFGFGRRGAHAEVTRGQVASDEAAKSNEELQKLAFDDHGNAVMALSGGTAEGGEIASRRLYDHWLENNQGYQNAVGRGDDAEMRRIEAETEEQRLNALAAAHAVGFKKSNASHALTSMAQNKSRSLGAIGAREMVSLGLDAASGGNAEQRRSLKDSFAYQSGVAGRADLSDPNAWNPEIMTPMIHAPTGEVYHVPSGVHEASRYASLNGFEKQSLYATGQGHPNGIASAGLEAGALIASGNEDDLQRAAVHLEELKAMATHTTGPMRDAANASIAELEGNALLQAHRGLATGGVTTERFDRERGDTQHARYDLAYVASWAPDEMARGVRNRAETYGDAARRTARVYGETNPNER